MAGKGRKNGKKGKKGKGKRIPQEEEIAEMNQMAAMGMMPVYPPAMAAAAANPGAMQGSWPAEGMAAMGMPQQMQAANAQAHAAAAFSWRRSRVVCGTLSGLSFTVCVH